jgi:hypothetical protein
MRMLSMQFWIEWLSGWFSMMLSAYDSADIIFESCTSLRGLGDEISCSVGAVIFFEVVLCWGEKVMVARYCYRCCSLLISPLRSQKINESSTTHILTLKPQGNNIDNNNERP